MRSIKRFAAVEGLRAWLAWAVVLDHIAYFSDIRGSLGHLLRGAGYPAVTTFIIISGFVITHLLVEQPEPYRYYLLRRFMRIFPLFAVTCVAGYFAYKLQMRLFDNGFAYGSDPEFVDLLRKLVINTDRYFWNHIIAHVTMLHGALSYNLLPYTDTAFNIPAWSISLEWQFYIVAPFIVAVLIKRPILTPLLAVLIVVSQLLFKWGWFGSYDQPATLLGMAGYFAVGVASRLFYPALVGKIKNQYVVLAAIIVLYGLTRQGSLAVWSVVYLGLLTTPPSIYHLALKSRLARYFGSRSYSVYLSHFIIIIGCEWLWIMLFSASPGFLPLLATTIPATIAIAELLYRYVEVPGINLGAKIVGGTKKTTVAERAIDQWPERHYPANQSHTPGFVRSSQ